MKIPGEKDLSWWAKKGSYGRAVSNMPGTGAGRLGGASGSYASASDRSSNPRAPKGKKVANNPGKGAGHMPNNPAKRPANTLGYMRMGDD